LLLVGAGFYGCSAGVIMAQLGTIARNFYSDEFYAKGVGFLSTIMGVAVLIGG